MNDTLPGTMKPNEKPTGELNKPVPIKWRATWDEEELVRRRLFEEDKTIVQKEHELWFGDGKTKRRELERLRAKHRKAGLADDRFRNPKAPPAA